MLQGGLSVSKLVIGEIFFTNFVPQLVSEWQFEVSSFRNRREYLDRIRRDLMMRRDPGRGREAREGKRREGGMARVCVACVRECRDGPEPTSV